MRIRSGPAAPGFRKLVLHTLHKLSQTTERHPRCYMLKDIAILGKVDNDRGLCHSYQGRYDEQNLCLKVIRLPQELGKKGMLKVCFFIPRIPDPLLTCHQFSARKQFYGVSSITPTSYLSMAFGTLMTDRSALCPPG